jgi:hypothetical protein
MASYRQTSMKIPLLMLSPKVSFSPWFDDGIFAISGLF